MRLLETIACVIITCVAVWPTSAWAQTTSVRVTASEAAIRQNPDSQSPAIATVKAGTVLEVVAGRQGDWYEVVLPATSSGSQRRGHIPANVVEPFTREQRVDGLTLPVTDTSQPAGASAGSVGTLAADWQARYDRAIQRRRAGNVKVRIGGPLGLTGGALGVYGLVKALQAGDDESKMPNANLLQYTGLGLAVGGGVLLGIGHGQMRRGSEELLLLETERVRARQEPVFGLLLTESEDLLAKMVVEVGSRTVAAVHVSW